MVCDCCREEAVKLEIERVRKELKQMKKASTIDKASAATNQPEKERKL